MDLKNVSFLNTQITLGFPNLTESQIDNFFNHLNKNPSQSVLTSIDSIDEKYESLKINLMEQLIDKLNSLNDQENSMVFVHTYAFSDILFKNKVYMKSEKVRHFITEKLEPYFIEAANTKGRVFNRSEIDIMFDILSSNKNNNEFYFKNSGFINQLIYSCHINNEESIKEKGRKVQADYLRNIPKAALVRVDEHLAGEGEHKNLFSEHKQMLLISADKEQLIIVRYKYYVHFCLRVNTDENFKWGDFYNIKKEGDLYSVVKSDKVHIENTFEKIRLFQSVFEIENKKNKVSDLFKLMDLGEANLNYFQEAIKQKSIHVEVNFSPFAQVPLAFALNKFLYNVNHIKSVKDLVLNDNFTPHMRELFDFKHMTSLYQSIVVSCLSVIFVKLSICPFFENEAESIFALRKFALALLNKALSYQEFPISENKVERWKDLLAREEEGFPPKIDLFNEMISELLIYPEHFKKIIPLAWQ